MRRKHVLSVSLGSSQRDFRLETNFLGEDFLIERIGANGKQKEAIRLIEAHDGKVDAFGLGGTDLFIQAKHKRYYLRDSLKLASHAKKSPIVCGAGLKNSLERNIVKQLDSKLQWQNKNVLMVSGLDRFGMAETLASLKANLIYGDLIFLLGLPIRLQSLASLSLAANIIAPIATQLPITWLYPTGSKQESAKASWRQHYFAWAEIIAGDFHLIKRYAPKDLEGKTILTNTTTAEDLKQLKGQNLKHLITTTPRLAGRSLATNLLEACLIAFSGRHPLEDADYQDLIKEARFEADFTDLNA